MSAVDILAPLAGLALLLAAFVVLGIRTEHDDTIVDPDLPDSTG